MTVSKSRNFLPYNMAALAEAGNANTITESSLFRLQFQEHTSSVPTIRVALAEDHPEMQVVLRLLLRLSADFELVCDVGNGLAAVDCVTRLQPDVMVMDIRMPVVDGLEATRRIVELGVGTLVILISSDRGGYAVKRAEDAGARGYVPKDDLVRDLPRAIRAVHASLALPGIPATSAVGDTLTVHTDSMQPVRVRAACLKGDFYYPLKV